MKALELVETLLNLVDRHGDLQVRAETRKSALADAAPITSATFQYNDDETEAWIELDWD